MAHAEAGYFKTKYEYISLSIQAWDGGNNRKYEKT